MKADSVLADVSSWSSEHRERNVEIAKAIEPVGKSAVLEVGCGSAAFSIELKRQLPAASLLGVDAQSSLVEKARVNAKRILGQVEGLRFECMDGRALRLSDSHFDFVCSSRLLLHAREPELLLAEMVRVAKPGAEFLFVEPSGGHIEGVEYRLFERTLGFRDPSFGARLPDVLSTLGFERLRVTEHEAKVIDSDLANALERSFEEGQGFQALACKRGRARVEDVHELIRQLRRADTGNGICRSVRHCVVRAEVGAKGRRMQFDTLTTRRGA